MKYNYFLNFAMLIPIIRVSLSLLKIPMHATIIYLGSQLLFENVTGGHHFLMESTRVPKQVITIKEL